MIRSLRLFICFGVMFGGLQNLVFAQNNPFLVQSKQLTYKTGLSSNHIYQTIKDSRGVIWIMHKNAIDRYDGVNIKQIDLPVLEKSSGWVFLLEDEEMNIWIRNKSGDVFFLHLFSEKLTKAQDKFSGFPQAVFRAIKANDHTYILQTTNGLVRYKLGGEPTFVSSEAMKSHVPLMEYPNGTLWVDEVYPKGGGNFWLIDTFGQKKKRVPYYNHYTSRFSGHLGDSLYVMTLDTIFVLDTNGLVKKKACKDLSPDQLNIRRYTLAEMPKLTVDKVNQWIWVYFPHELMILDHSLRLIYRFNAKSKALPTNYVFAIAMLSQQQVWLGTINGLHQVSVQKNLFTQYLTTENGVAGLDARKSCRGITQGADHSVYAMASPSIYQLLPDGGVKELLRLPPKDEGFATTLEADQQGNLWFMSGWLRSVHVQTGEMQTYPVRSEGETWSLEISDNQIWVGNPLVCWDIATKTSKEVAINSFTEIKGAIIYDFQPKSASEFWLLSNKGLYVLSKEKGIVARYWSGGKGAFHLPFDDLRHGWEKSPGEWWLATTKGILNWNMHHNTAHLYGKESGIPANCHAVLVDKKGDLWVSTDFGLIQFDPQKKRARSFFTKDGLSSNEFNRQSHFKDAQGYMYFGGLNGLVRFDPDRISEDWMSKFLDIHLVLAECSIFSGESNRVENIRTEVLQRKVIDVYPGDRFLKVQVALTDFVDPERVLYEYRIRGFEEHWQKTKESTLIFAGLPYGQYTLEIQAQAGIGVAVDEKLRVEIIVHRPFYLQTWFLVLLMFTGGLSIYAFIKWRTQNLKNRAIILEETVQERTQTIGEQQKRIKQMYDLKSRMYANISHEFKTPLTLILGPANRALPKAQALPEPELAQTLEQIVTHGQQMLGLVNQIIDLNKLESDALSPVFEQVDLIPFLVQLLEPFHVIAQQKDIQMKFKTTIESFVLEVDVENTAKILNNLLSNALKFTEAGGQVRVSVEQVDTWCLVVVSDTGRGIDSVNLQSVFDRFFQVENARNRRSEGSGIGLALVKELTELVGGRIEVNSSVGKGSQFRLLLPLRNSSIQRGEVISVSPQPIRAPRMSPEKREKPSKVKLPRIVVIEDNLAIAQFIESCLEGHYKVRVFTDSKKGLADVQSTPPDLIICDIMMPEMDGYELCTCVKSDERTSHVPLVFLSALQESMDRKERLVVGAEAFITKPFKAEELQVLVATVLAQRRRLQKKYLRVIAANDEADAAMFESVNKTDLQMLFALKEIILEQLDNPNLSIQVLCRIMGISQSQLHRKLNALTGLSAGRYITYVRLEEAQKMLLNTQLSVTEVAFRTGFSDPAYFTRQFVKSFGQSPRQFKLSSKQESTVI